MGRIFLAIGFSLASVLAAYGQSVITIEANVLNSVTQEPIEFANIGFLNRGMGTVSNERGKFILRFDEDRVLDEDVFQISTLGYETQQFVAKELYTYLESTSVIYLDPKLYELDQVLITSKTRVPLILGNTTLSEGKIGYWKDRDGLGGEIATRVRVPKRDTKLKNLSFHVLDNLSDSLKIRVNIYQYKNRFPKENLLKANIYHTIDEEKGKVSIPLSDYDIVVDDDIVVSIELVRFYGNDIYFSVAAHDGGGISYTRTRSQDKWVRYMGTGMGFSLDASAPKKKSRK